MKALAFIGCAVVVAGTVVGAEPTFRTIVLTGAQAPGLPAGVMFSYVGDARINTQGRVAFWADLAGPGVTPENSNSIWTDRTGTLVMTQRQGDSAPFGANIVWGAFPSPALGADGRIAFTASLVDPAAPGPVNLGVFTDDPGAGNTRVIAREGFQAAGLPQGTNWAMLPVAGLGAPGGAGSNAVFNANTGRGVWSGAPGGDPVLVARAGVAVPGVPAGHTLSYLDQPAVGSAGLLFRASTSDGAVPTPAFSTGLWSAAGGAVAPVFVAGSAAPGFPAGVVFDEFGLQPASAGGRAAFYAEVIGPGIGETNDGAIYAGPVGAPALVAREGDIAPGGGQFWVLGKHPVVSSAGAVAFFAHLGGIPNAEGGVWAAAAGGPLALVAREGLQAPRLPAGVTFAGFGEPAMNDAGQIAFMARLAGAGVTPANSSVLYAADRAGRIYPLVRTGDLFDVGGQARVVDEILFDSAGAEGGHSQFAGTAAGGELVMKLVFRDASLPPQEQLSSGLFGAAIRCLPDLSGNGAVTVDDFIMFMNAFAAEDLRKCDYSGNGLLDVSDFVFFMNAAAAGCP